jgi:MoaA/NifB/PqqE/SkfB family radical SAM enzyme
MGFLLNGMFKQEYKNDVMYWGNHIQLLEGDVFSGPRLRHLDLDYGDTCSLSCPHCFRRDSRFDTVTDNNRLAENDIRRLVKEAQNDGLESVKILGRGEPFQSSGLLAFIDYLCDLGLGVSIFTKGHVIGSDDTVHRYFGDMGISTGKKLVSWLKERNTSILLGFNSFRADLQEEFIGQKASSVSDYVKCRDTALERLITAGFNDYVPGSPTRLALIAAPIKPENVEEVFDIYTWARLQNIYMLSCPTTISGKGLDEAERQKTFKNYMDQLVLLYARIYKWNIDHGLVTVQRLQEEGISLYPGCHPCTQISCGLYLNLSGQVVQCPGRVDEETIFTNDIRHEESLNSVWLRSINFKRANGELCGQFGNSWNYGCPARDGLSLPSDFYSRIMERINIMLKQ